MIKQQELHQLSQLLPSPLTSSQRTTEQLKVYKHYPMHLSVFELCLKSWHLAFFLPSLNFFLSCSLENAAVDKRMFGDGY